MVIHDMFKTFIKGAAEMGAANLEKLLNHGWAGNYQLGEIKAAQVAKSQRGHRYLVAARAPEEFPGWHVEIKLCPGSRGKPGPELTPLEFTPG